MIKICHITSAHTRFDSRIFYKECLSLKKYYEVVLLVADGKGDESSNGINIRDIGKSKSIVNRILWLWIKIFYDSLKINAKVYHFHDPELIVVGLLLKILNKKVIYDIHEDYTTSIKQRAYIPLFLHNILSVLYSYMEKFASLFFINIIAEKYYSKRFKNAIQILNYPHINIEQNNYKAISNVEKKLLYTGNLTIDRGALIYANIINLVPEIEIYCVGYCSEDVYNLMNQIIKNEDAKKRLHVVGVNRFINFKEIVDYYEKYQWLAGLAIFPETPHYKNKELTKFFEYMVYRIPVLCSNFPAWSELIGLNKCGILVEPNNMENIKKGVNYLLQNQDMVEILGENGKNAVIDKYNWNKEEEKLIHLYNQILNDK